MNSSVMSTSTAIRTTCARLFRGLSLVAALLTLVGTVHAQADQQDRRNRRGGDNNNNNNGGGRGNFDPQQMQQQMLDRIREQFGITDDAEWKIISDRLTAVTEARRNAGGGVGGMFGGRGGPPPGGGRGGDTGGGGGRRGGFGGSPEQDSLRQAVTDNLPDAELKSRMARLRETRKANEEKLARAQEELRAVLSVRQEAVAVMFGLIP
ncbi:MAG: hypothetical protein HZA93_13740 [Verrucomicrobia bacterium]|nr:hypothetical protein [Verrucomicrobiota bacterium]